MKIKTTQNRIVNGMRLCIGAVIMLAAAGPFSLPAQDAPKSDAKPNDGQIMAMIEELGKPDQNHRLLARTAGRWDYTIKYWMDPNGAPMESSGKTVTKMIMGGRYAQSEVSGKMQMPGANGQMKNVDFEGMSLEGFDRVKKKFVASWVDNMGTAITLSEGTYDPAAKAITYLFEEEPLPGMKAKARQVVTYIDDDHHTVAFYENRGGQEMKTMEMSYTRK